MFCICAAFVLRTSCWRAANHALRCSPQEAITSFQWHGSIIRVAPAPPRAGMQRAETALWEKLVSIEWLLGYLLPPELEAVARASVFAGPFTADGAVAVGCGASLSAQQQKQSSAIAAGVEQVLDALVQMSVLREEGASHTGGRRFSMHPLIRELGRELRGGQLKQVFGGEGSSVEVLMVQWMVADEGGPGARLGLHQPAGGKPDIRVCQGVMGEEVANFQEAARQLGSAGGSDGCVADVGLQEKVLGMRARVLGPSHPRTLGTMYNLAVCLQDMGDLSKAHALHKKVLDMQTKVLGPEHPTPSTPPTT
jgi:hypothetical protein